MEGDRLAQVWKAGPAARTIATAGPAGYRANRRIGGQHVIALR